MIEFGRLIYPLDREDHRGANCETGCFRVVFQ